ncbi:MAG: trigger factor [Bifidobacteriaceae bacterium]|nr:trigger factor [Bifidobacteriaceae bacterium]
MKSAVEVIDPTTVKLTIDVAPEDLKTPVELAYKEISTHVRVPGFRPGKVPSRIIDQRIGRGAVIQQAVEQELDNWYREALTEHQVEPMGPPEVEFTKEIDPASPELSLAFTAVVETRPKIDIPDLTKIKVEVAPVELTEAELDQAMDGLRARFATLVPVDRPAKDGDFATLDLTAQIDGQEVDSVSSVSYQLGGGNMLDGLDEALDGLSAGETTTFEAPLTGGSRAGEKALITVTLEAVKERELPAADDEFAQLASEFDTIDELRESLRELGLKSKQTGQLTEARNKLTEHLIETLAVPAPPGVVAANAEHHLEHQGVAEPTEEQLDKAKEEVAADIKQELVWDAIARHLGVQVTNRELGGYLAQMAADVGVDLETFIDVTQRSGELPHFVRQFARNKASVEALRQIKAEDTNGNEVDLAASLPEFAEEELPPVTSETDDDLIEDLADEALSEELAIDLGALAEASDEDPKD